MDNRLKTIRFNAGRQEAQVSIARQCQKLTQNTCFITEDLYLCKILSVISNNYLLFKHVRFANIRIKISHLKGSFFYE